jgi:hypothetical protein
MLNIQVYLILGCLTVDVFSLSWTKLSDGKCYAKVDHKLSWNEAKRYCNSESAILATHAYTDASNINLDFVKFFGKYSTQFACSQFQKKKLKKSP